MSQLEMSELVGKHCFDLFRLEPFEQSVENTMRRAAPNPVKYALPWLDRVEPSITNSPLAANPHRASRRSTRSLSGMSASGRNLLNNGAMTVG